MWILEVRLPSKNPRVKFLSGSRILVLNDKRAGAKSAPALLSTAPLPALLGGAPQKPQQMGHPGGVSWR